MKYENTFKAIDQILWKEQGCGARDRIAMKIAARHGKIQEYKKARRQNMRALKVLDGWGLADEEEIKKYYD